MPAHSSKSRLNCAGRRTTKRGFSARNCSVVSRTVRGAGMPVQAAHLRFGTRSRASAPTFERLPER